MKIRNTSMKFMAAACIAIALAPIWETGRVAARVTHRSNPAGNAPALPAVMMAAGQPRTDLDVFTLNADRTVWGKISGKEWADATTGFNITRTYVNNAGQTRLFALNGNTGAAQTFALHTDGNIGAAMFVSDTPRKEYRCTSAEFVKIGDVTKLITHDSFTGMIRTFVMNLNGIPDLATMTSQTLPEMRDKNLFSVYESYMIGVNTWTGETATYSITMQKISGTTWTRGWTSIDHLKIGPVIYRLLYKAAGDPYKKTGESGDQARRFRIETVNSNGATQIIQDTYLGDDGGDFSSVRFVQFPHLNAEYSHGIFLYKRTTGEYELYGFDPQTGLGDKIDDGRLKDGFSGDSSAAEAPPYIDIEPFLMNGATYLAFVNADNAKPLGYEQAENMGRIMHNSLNHNVVGYQFMLAQSGRIYFSRAYGKSRLDHNSALEENMTSRTQLNVGSVSKVITAVTMLKLAEMKKLNLSDKISGFFPTGQINADSWPYNTPVLNLLTHTSGISKDLCMANGSNLTVNCQPFFNEPHDSDLDCVKVNGVYNCSRSYNNSNTIAARTVIESVTGARDSKDIVKKTRELWANVVDLEKITCQINPAAYYYGPCDGAEDCFNYAGKSWRRDHPVDSYPSANDAWSARCSSGGWYASSRELIEFLSAIRYRKALDQTHTDMLIDTGLMGANGGATAIGWDPGWSADGEKNLDKGGYLPYNGVAAKAYITRLPNNCDAVVQFNSETSQSGTNLLQDAYRNAVLGQMKVVENGDYTYPADHNFAENSAINTVSTGTAESKHVVVSRDANDNLKLGVFRASRQSGSPALDLITEKTASGLGEGYSYTDMAISDGRDFATVSLDKAKRLNIIAWNLNDPVWNSGGDQLTQHAGAIGPMATEVAVAKVAAAGPRTRIVTAIRDLNRKLRLDVWDIDNFPLGPPQSTITHKGSFIGQSAEMIDIKHLGAVGDLSKPARFVTANSDLNQNLVVTTWEVAANGALQIKHNLNGGTEPVSTDIAFPHRVAIDAVGDGASGFFNGKGFMTTSITASGKLNVITWSVNDFGIITQKDSELTNGTVKDQAVSATTTAVALKVEDGQAKLIKWAVDSDGNITRAWDRTLNFWVTNIAVTDNLVGAFVQQTPTFRLMLVNWTALAP